MPRPGGSALATRQLATGKRGVGGARGKDRARLRVHRLVGGTATTAPAMRPSVGARPCARGSLPVREPAHDPTADWAAPTAMAGPRPVRPTAPNPSAPAAPCGGHVPPRR